MEWHRFRKHGSPSWGWRQDRFHSLKLVLRVDPTSTTLIDLLNGGLMGNPSLMQMTGGSSVTTEVVIILATNSGHNLLETSQLVLEVFNRIMENIQGGGLLSNYLPKIMGLKRDLSISQIDIQSRLRTLDFSCLNIHQRRSIISRFDHLSNEATSVG